LLSNFGTYLMVLQSQVFGVLYTSIMAKKVTQTTLIERVWDIEGFPNYFFGADKHLYRFDSRGRIRRNKRVMLRYTAGYVLRSRFYSLKQLRSLLRRHDPASVA
jgi:hypothetical protein